MTDMNLRCPECGNPLTKAGGAWSGKRKIQQFRCPNPKCRRTTIRPLDTEGNKMEAKPFGESHQIDKAMCIVPKGIGRVKE